jgi:phosphoglycolate phosphatase-like HAD superfamily hydrolase
MLQGERYRAQYLQSARPFSGLRRLFTAIRDSNAKIALATSCDKDELAHYRAIMNVDDLIDEACCGEDVRREKPSSEIVVLAAKRVRLPPAQIVMIGDTPYDAEAACRAEVTAIGLQSGHFSRADLIDAGCFSVFFDLQALSYKLVDQAAAIVPSSDHKLSQGAESC